VGDPQMRIVKVYRRDGLPTDFGVVGLRKPIKAKLIRPSKTYPHGKPTIRTERSFAWVAMVRDGVVAAW